MRARIAAALLPLAALLSLSASHAAQPAAAGESLTWLHGNWKGDATLFGQPATVRLSAGPVLRGTATALTYSAEIPAKGDQPEFRFEGRGTYRAKPDGQVSGQWNDSQGNFHPLAGRVKGTALTVTWGEPRTEVGHSSYVLDGEGMLTVTDSEIGGGKLRTFGVGKYRRE
jgi:hypothetical protein